MPPKLKPVVTPPGLVIDPEEAHELYKAFATATELQKKDYQNTRPAVARHRQGPS